MLRNTLLAAMLAAAGAMAAAPAAADAPQNMLVIGTDLRNLRTLDPANSNAQGLEMLANVYDTLVQITRDDLTRIKPMLATDWTLSEDQRTITFNLREDATFESGNSVTAADAAWSIQRVIKRGQVGSTNLALWGFTAENVEDYIRATDTFTLQIELPQEVNYNLILQSLAEVSIGIIEKQVALEHEVDGDLAAKWLSNNTAGSGAFTITDWRPNEIALFNARQDYWNGAPAMVRVAVRHIPESGNLRLQLESGDIDIAQFPASGDLEALENNENVKIQNVPGFGFYYIGLNMQDPDLQKPLVRRAFRHIFDWESVGDISRYIGFPWQSVIPKGMLGHPDEESAVSRNDYDPELARSLLAEAGYPDGLSKKLYPSGATQMPLAEALQSSAKAAGVDFDLVQGEWTPAYRTRNFDVMLAGSAAKLPDPFSVTTLTGFNPDNSDEARLAGYHMWRASFSNPELNSLITESGKESDPEKRAEIFRRIDEVYHTMDSPIILFFQRTDPYAIRTDVEGYQAQPNFSTRWGKVTKE